MSSSNFDVKSEILKAINGTNEPAMRTVLMLMLGLFESVNEKLDAVLSDEAAMRIAVLNGHEPVHHGHHEWIERRIKHDPEIESLVAWATARKASEEQSIQSGRKIREGVIEKVIAAILIGAVSFFVGRGSF